MYVQTLPPLSCQSRKRIGDESLTCLFLLIKVKIPSLAAELVFLFAFLSLFPHTFATENMHKDEN